MSVATSWDWDCARPASAWVHARWWICRPVALTVFIHYWLDIIVNAPDIPVLGEESWHLGLGLWNHLSLASALEVVVLLLGIWFYLRAYHIGRKKTIIFLIGMRV